MIETSRKSEKGKRVTYLLLLVLSFSSKVIFESSGEIIVNQRVSRIVEEIKLVGKEIGCWFRVTTVYVKSIR